VRLAALARRALLRRAYTKVRRGRGAIWNRVRRRTTERELQPQTASTFVHLKCGGINPKGADKCRRCGDTVWGIRR